MPLARVRARIARRLRSARRLLVATDFDGTLAPLADHPTGARLDPRALAALTALRGRPGVRLAVLSGRRLDDLRRRVPLAGVFLVGSGGLETRDERGRRRTLVAPAQRLPAALRASLRAWCARFEGTWLEAKPLALAVHDRALDPRRRAAFAAGVRRRVARAEHARILRGRRVFEILPGGRADKAVALASWLADGTGVVLFYFGDDTNDEPAHRLVARRGGYAVAVGRDVPGARYRLASEAAVGRFLTWLDREWAARAHRGRAARAPARPRRRARR